ncbi:MAG: alginate lyase family protein [Vicinamibacterales bacterium]
MNARTALRRIVSMQPQELGFRIAADTRTRLDGLRHRVRPRRWSRHSLAKVLDPAIAPLVADAVQAARLGSFDESQQALQQRFRERASVWPIAARRRQSITSVVASTFPRAASLAHREALRLLEGRCDLLGYQDLRIGAPPDWHADPVHRRRAPRCFSADVQYLDPNLGDHKVIWEINRHQQWLTLGRAYWLTRDQRIRDAFVTQFSDWIANNPPLSGINWSSMLELALRSLSWTWAIEFFADEQEPDTAGQRPPWLVDLLVAVDAQLTHVSRNLSRYFSPNTHLTGEALGLYAVSLALPELRRSAARVDLGRSILLAEANRQILNDGGHVERSPHYHRYSTDFYLLAFLVARAADDPAAPAFEQALRAQSEYLRVIADDRGQLPLIGDDDGGQLFPFGARPSDARPTLNALAALLNDPALAVNSLGPETLWIVGGDVQPMQPSLPPDGTRLLADSGYVVSRQSGSHLVFDVGPHGYLNGGHGHTDALSIVATIDGDPVLVDPGTATYTMDAGARDRFRSARMHNTVTLDGLDCGEPAGPFHWHRIANARVLRHESALGSDVVYATHDGYASRPHARIVVAVETVGWLVIDHIATTRPRVAEAWWHLHPAWTVSIRGGNALLLHASGRRSSLAFAGGTLGALDDPLLCAYAPEYGRIEHAPVLRVTRSDTQAFALAAFISCRHASEAATLRPLALTNASDAGEIGSGWRIETDRAALDVFVGPGWPQPCIRRDRATRRAGGHRREAAAPSANICAG